MECWVFGEPIALSPLTPPGLAPSLVYLLGKEAILLRKDFL
jgi:hypothetical protein